jgi:hypothetical protein
VGVFLWAFGSVSNNVYSEERFGDVEVSSAGRRARSQASRIADPCYNPVTHGLIPVTYNEAVENQTSWC